MSPTQFLEFLSEQMECSVVRHTKLIDKSIHKVACCGGSGSFLIADAMREGADVYVSADFKYHEFFEADDKIIIADIGHFETEQCRQ